MQQVKILKIGHRRNLIFAAQASNYFATGQYIQSAQCFAQSSTSFEEVALKFIDGNQRDALRYYLMSRLERTKKTVSVLLSLARYHLINEQELIQRMMLVMWLVDLYLSKYNELEDVINAGSFSQNVDNLRTELTLLDDELKQFLGTYSVSEVGNIG